MNQPVKNLPLSMAQQGLWFLSSIDETVSAAYNVVCSFELSAAPDLHVLRQSLAAVIARHESLRCAIRNEGGIARCEVIDPAALPPIGIGIGQESLESVARTQTVQAFDLQAPPLVRVIHVGAGASSPMHGLVFSFPHLVFDDASAAVFFSDLAAAYAAFETDAAPAWQAAGSPAAAVEHERRFVAGSDCAQLLKEYASRLSGLPSAVSLAVDGPSTRSPDTVRPGAGTCIRLDDSWTTRVRDFARQERVSSAAVHLAAFQLLVWHHSRSSDFGVCIPIRNRPSESLAGTVGYLTNLGLFRARVQSGQTIRQLLQETTGQMLDMLDAQSLPFPLLAKALKRVGEDIQGPLLQIGFNHTAGAGDLQLGGIRMRRVDVLPSRVKNEFKLDVQESGGTTLCWLLFDRNLYDDARIEQMAGHYRTLLKAVVEQPQRKLRDVQLLDAQQLHQVLVQFNDTAVEYSKACCVHELFEQQVAARPDAAALIHGDQQLSYAQLNERANQLAHALRAMGVGPDMLVALCLRRSADLVVAVLGVLKAGAAYVPLDPQHPSQRLGFMLRDTAASVLLSQQELVHLLPAHDARTMLMDDASLASQPSHNPAPLAKPHHLAYCIYTSGSTGHPKGALNDYAGVVNRLLWMQGAYGLQADDVVLQKTPSTFDVSVWEFFWPLLAGARLVVADHEGHKDPKYLAELMAAQGVTTVHFVPSMLQAFLTHLAPDQARSLPIRRLFCSGEALPRTLERACHDKLPQIQLHNLYGPTECAVDVTHWTCRADSTDERIPIGRPVANTQIYICDESLNPVPQGVAGELYIAGIQVGRGYLGRPDLTAQQFVPNPFGAPGSRMYKSGDLARHRRDGSIEFLGRIDHQVKLRGLRIELGEIENALLLHPVVKECVVVAQDLPNADKRLVAYVVGNGTDVPTLRAHLALSLPEYMIPAAWVFLEALPLNANGKLDRRALPAADSQDAQTGTPFVAPRTPTEQLLADIWAQVLRVQRVGIHDNFFSLGGHSLLATQVVSRIKEQGLGDVTVRVLFDSPTIERLAQAVLARPATATSAAADAPIPRLRRPVQTT